MTNLLLIRHFEPAWGPENPPAKWELIERRRQCSRSLGDYLVERRVGAVFASLKFKATKTTEITAEVAGFSNVVLVHDLREHEREETFIISEPERRALVIDCIQRSDELIYGSVPVRTAPDRFGDAIANLMTAKWLRQWLLPLMALSLQRLLPVFWTSTPYLYGSHLDCADWLKSNGPNLPK